MTSQRGFTLIELIVVVLMIGIVAIALALGIFAIKQAINDEEMPEINARRSCAHKGWIVNEYNCRSGKSTDCEWQCIPPPTVPAESP